MTLQLMDIGSLVALTTFRRARIDNQPHYLGEAGTALDRALGPAGVRHLF